jgi:hypothetical protein
MLQNSGENIPSLLHIITQLRERNQTNDAIPPNQVSGLNSKIFNKISSFLDSGRRKLAVENKYPSTFIK